MKATGMVHILLFALALEFTLCGALHAQLHRDADGPERTQCCGHHHEVSLDHHDGGSCHDQKLPTPDEFPCSQCSGHSHAALKSASGFSLPNSVHRIQATCHLLVSPKSLGVLQGTHPPPPSETNLLRQRLVSVVLLT